MEAIITTTPLRWRCMTGTTSRVRRSDGQNVRSSAAPVHLHVRRIWLGRGHIFGAAATHELPEVGPQTWVAQKVNHDARVACVRRFEDYRDLPVFVSQLIFRQPPPTEYRRRFRPV